MTRDPAMPRLMPPAVERALLEVLGWRNAAAAPIDVYMAIYDGLVGAGAGTSRSTPPRDTMPEPKIDPTDDPRCVRLFAAIGMLSNSWAHVEYAIEGVILAVKRQPSLAAPPPKKKLPLGTQDRIEYFRQFITATLVGHALQDEFVEVCDELAAQVPLRHRVVHGVIVSVDGDAQGAGFARVMHTRNDLMVDEYHLSAETIEAEVPKVRLLADVLLKIAVGLGRIADEDSLREEQLVAHERPVTAVKAGD